MTFSHHIPMKQRKMKFFCISLYSTLFLPSMIVSLAISPINNNPTTSENSTQAFFPNTITTESPVDEKYFFSPHNFHKNSTFQSLNNNSMNFELLTTSPLIKITRTIENEFNRLFNEDKVKKVSIKNLQADMVFNEQKTALEDTTEESKFRESFSSSSHQQKENIVSSHLDKVKELQTSGNSVFHSPEDHSPLLQFDTSTEGVDSLFNGKFKAAPKRVDIPTEIDELPNQTDPYTAIADAPLKQDDRSFQFNDHLNNKNNGQEDALTELSKTVAEQNKGSVINDNIKISVNEEPIEIELSNFDFTKGDDCFYATSQADIVEWRKGSKAIKVIFPTMDSTSCESPTKCKNFPTTVHKILYIQDGDSIEVELSIRSTSTRQLSLGKEKAESGESESSFSIEETKMDDPSPNIKVNISSAQKRLKNTKIVPQRSSIFKRNVQQPPKNSEFPSITPLIIWKVTENEWDSCSTREGGQVAISDPSGLATIEDTDLPPGDLYFIGRSSWSSSECFKLKVVVKGADCGEGSICSGKGKCFSNTTMNEFSCGCCHGYKGVHCEEKDACADIPCQNFGMCVDIKEGHDGATFQCLCKYGYGGKLCETRRTLCNSNPCKNGGSCHGNSTSFTCVCPSGWSGRMCEQVIKSGYSLEENLDFDYPSKTNDYPFKINDYFAKITSSYDGCKESPCVHGVCIETSEKDFRCFCQQGFGGERCESEYNECDSNPCLNGGTCVDQIGSFDCLCDRGYSGHLCSEKTDLCNPELCPEDSVCVDKGNTVSCECLPGITSENCEQRLRTASNNNVCIPNPCSNGGTCNPLLNSQTPYCACRPGFTGLTCQDSILQTPEPTFVHVTNFDQSNVLIKVSSNDNNPNYGDPIVLESVGPVGTLIPTKDIHSRHSHFRGPLSHMRNLYTAAVTLTCAFMIFLLVLSVCHCCINKPYGKCILPFPSRAALMPNFRRIHFTSLRDKKRRDRLNSLRYECDPDGASVPMTSHCTNENTYYNIEDNQELPLIK